MTPQRTTRAYVVPYAGQGSAFGADDLQAIDALLRSGAHLANGVERDAFEAEFAAAVGASYAVSTTSCTVALQLATHLARLRSGDEVIVTPLTYQATLNVLLALPVQVTFCDVDPATLCLDAARLAELISPRTRAVFLTHYGGLMADIEAIAKLTREHGAFLVEDCAHALGAADGATQAGTVGDAGCWSFQSLKNISTLGQGGMLTLRSAEHAALARRLRAVEPDADFEQRAVPTCFGRHEAPAPGGPVAHDKNAWTHDCTAIRAAGTNAMMSEPAAAVGRVQLRKLDAFVEQRRSIARRFDDAIEALPGIRAQLEPAGQRHAYHLYTAFVDGRSGLSRDVVARRLEADGVEVILRYFPLHLLPEWRLRGGRYGACPVAERVWFDQLLNLPIYPTMTEAQVDHVVGALRRAVTACDARVSMEVA
jgi:perosamine synthetase